MDRWVTLPKRVTLSTWGKRDCCARGYLPQHSPANPGLIPPATQANLGSPSSM